MAIMWHSITNENFDDPLGLFNDQNNFHKATKWIKSGANVKKLF